MIILMRGRNPDWCASVTTMSMVPAARLCEDSRRECLRVMFGIHKRSLIHTCPALSCALVVATGVWMLVYPYMHSEDAVHPYMHSACSRDGVVWMLFTHACTKNIEGSTYARGGAVLVVSGDLTSRDRPHVAIYIDKLNANVG